MFSNLKEDHPFTSKAHLSLLYIFSLSPSLSLYRLLQHQRPKDEPTNQPKLMAKHVATSRTQHIICSVRWRISSIHDSSTAAAAAYRTAAPLRAKLRGQFLSVCTHKSGAAANVLHSPAAYVSLLRQSDLFSPSNSSVLWIF